MRPFRYASFIVLTAALAAPVAAQPVFEPPGFGEMFDLDPPDAPAPSPAPAPADEQATTPADGPVPAAPSVPAPDRAERLDTLFAELKRERSDEAAQGVAARIQAEWLTAESETTSLLMLWSSEAIAREDKPAALDLLDQAILLDPDYAEAWNRRATLNYELSRYGRSIADIEQTLAREPRHFGAMMGLATMLEMFDRKDAALRVYLQVLDVYPAMKGAQDAAGRLAEETSGQPS